MKFQDFEYIMSAPRMNRYLMACSGNSKKAMTLYRFNLRASQEFFTVISCFEVSLPNAIDRHYSNQFGNDWLRNAAVTGGVFDAHTCRFTKNLINQNVANLSHHYMHQKLIAEMDFGFWRYLFAQPQFRAAGQTLLRVFPAKPRSTPYIQYNQAFVFNQLGHINKIRNRIAHHEPICFLSNHSTKDTTYMRQHYAHILQLFNWMSIDEAALLYGLDHINTVCNQIDRL